MAEELLLVQKEGNICTLTINRPDRRNSLNPEVLLQLGDTLNSLKEEGEIRVVVIRGAGEQSFSSGYDIGRIPSGGNQEETGPQSNPLEYGMSSILAYPYPVIAMIYGYAVGAGLELAVTCDLRLVADTARLGITPAKLGVVYHHAGFQKFLNLVGVAQTKELFYTGRLIDAQRAREIGLVDHVVPAQELASATYDMAREIAENAPLSVSGAKVTVSKLLNNQRLSPEDEAELQKLWTQAMLSEDLKEGQRAFMEKRKPRFIGR
ncbi:enoyl-CoA hydratase/isomerase family protein [Chloroflexota bacterium]